MLMDVSKEEFGPHEKYFRDAYFLAWLVQCSMKVKNSLAFIHEWRDDDDNLY